MRKHFKTFLFAALTCSLLLGAGISAEAASKIRIDDTNFAWAVKEYAVEADTNDDGYLSKKEAAKIKDSTRESDCIAKSRCCHHDAASHGVCCRNHGDRKPDETGKAVRTG